MSISSKSKFTCLPTDIHQNIFSYLDSHQIGLANLVNKKFHSTVSHEISSKLFLNIQFPNFIQIPARLSAKESYKRARLGSAPTFDARAILNIEFSQTIVQTCAMDRQGNLLIVKEASQGSHSQIAKCSLETGVELLSIDTIGYVQDFTLSPDQSKCCTIETELNESHPARALVCVRNSKDFQILFSIPIFQNIELTAPNICWSPCSQKIAVSDDHGIAIWNITNREPELTIEGSFEALGFTAYEKSLIVLKHESFTSIQEVIPEDGSQTTLFFNHSEYSILNFAIHPQKRKIALVQTMSSHKNFIMTLDIVSGNIERIEIPNTLANYNISWSSDGKKLACSISDSEVIFFNDDLKKIACNIIISDARIEQIIWSSDPSKILILGSKGVSEIVHNQPSTPREDRRISTWEFSRTPEQRMLKIARISGEHPFKQFEILKLPKFAQKSIFNRDPLENLSIQDACFRKRHATALKIIQDNFEIRKQDSNFPKI